MMNKDFPDRKTIQEHLLFYILRMALVSLYGMSDLSSIMSNYLDEVWF
jgi:hypothetical protein